QRHELRRRPRHSVEGAGAVILVLLLACVGIHLAVSALAVAIRRPAATPIVYGSSLLTSLASFVASVAALLQASAPASLALPLGVPWIGAHFRLDGLSAYFLAVVSLGAFAASLFALGYGRHEETPTRVLPFYPAFLAGMTLVVLADDAFTYLLSWEF